MDISQRRLASLAGISYKSLQLIEAGGHDARLSTLESIARSMGYPPNIIARELATLFTQPVASIAMTAARICKEGKDSWRIHLFNFVDAFRCERDEAYIASPPPDDTPPKVAALVASTVESLCAEMELAAPWWCDGIPPLAEPWFVADVENLKASALVESPAHFRKRNIFVLANFLERR